MTSRFNEEENDDYPKGRMLRSMCRVFDPERNECSYFLPSGFKNRYIEVWEDYTGDLQVRYVFLDAAPEGVNALLQDSWAKQPS